MYVYKKKLYVLLFSLIDAAGNAIFGARKLFRRKIPLEFNRILLIRVDHIGDVINAAVVLDPLRRSFPNAAIDLLAPSLACDIVRDNKANVNVISFDPPWFDRGSSGFFKHLKGLREMVKIIRNGQYDVCMDLRGDFRHIMAMFLAGVRCRVGYGITGGGFLLTHNVPYKGVMHETDRNMELLRAIGIKEKTPGIKLYFSDEDKNTADKLLSDSGVRYKYAVLHIAPGHPAKGWDLEKFAPVVQYLFREKQLVPVMVGVMKDGKKVQKISELIDARLIDMTGKTPFGVLYYLLSSASLFIGVDSGPAHIAALANIPAIILFSGINDPCQWAPKGNRVRLVYRGKGKDLSGVQPDEVCRKIDEVIRE